MMYCPMKEKKSLKEESGVEQIGMLPLVIHIFQGNVS